MKPRLGGLVLAGGASSRMGFDKATADWLGMRAIDRVVALAGAAGANPVFCVGGPACRAPHVAERTPRCGPVGGILAGAEALLAAGCDWALVLAVDAPTLRLADIAPLVAKPDPGAAFDGLHLPMTIDLRRIPADAQPGWPVGRFVERAGLARLTCPDEARMRIRGANTPSERDALLSTVCVLGG